MPYRITTDTYTGKRFRWNETALVDGWEVPARCTSRSYTHLHPARTPAALLRELNPRATESQLTALLERAITRESEG